MKSNFIHVCFIIDESGSMSSSTNDVISGFNEMVEKQKAEKNGTCAISLYKFNDEVIELYVGKDVNEVSPLVKASIEDFSGFVGTPSFTQRIKSVFNFGSNTSDTLNIADILDNPGELNVKDDLTISDELNIANTYCPDGCTAMNDGIGTAIDNIGKWLADMPEDERPEKNLIVIMTDGMENASHKYSLQKVQEMIKHQTEVYSWSFMYIGTDISTQDAANSLGINLQSYNTRDDVKKSYEVISNSACAYRSYSDNMSMATKCMAFNKLMADTCDTENATYAQKTGIQMDKIKV